MRTLVLLAAVAGVALAAPTPNITDFARKYAPSFRYDSAAGSGGYCFPSSAEDYYTTRMAGDTSQVCNRNYTLVEGGHIPTYWHAQVCGYHLHIAYWSFFGWNDNCDCCSGRRNAWFESLVVKVRDYSVDPRMHEVRFGQKSGWYTRVPGRYSVTADGHPVAYVGKASHGFYHDDGGSGTCCYYEDFRDTGDHMQHLDSWHNLVQLDNSTAWMTDSTNHAWSGIYSPEFRGDWDLCKLNGCSGASLQLCTASGCAKSDISDSPF